MTATARAGLALDAKIRLLTGASMFTLWPEPDLGLSELRLSDGPTGVRGLQFLGGQVVALLPNATLLAASWSEDNTREAGVILAQEAMAQQIHVVLGPTVNLHRSPLGGRLFEAYSEDPLLTGRLAAAYVSGLQCEQVGACPKHLVANESETDRNTVNSVLDEATLRELYLLPFQIAVEYSDPWAIMAAYNDVNGVPATEQHHVINEIVKGEWGYTGLVVSDWFATKTAGPAANGGLDLVMPGPRGPWGRALVNAVRSGEVSEAVLDDHLARLLRLADGAGPPGVRVRVVNTGSRRSREVVQLYVQPADHEHPVRLAGWATLTADPGESAMVDVVADPRLCRYWDTPSGRWAPLEPGQLIVARGLGDIRHVLDL